MTSDSLSLHTGKQGCTAEELPELVHYLLKECSHLELCGLMTIGRMRHSIQQGPNPDFTVSAANLYQSCSESLTTGMFVVTDTSSVQGVCDECFQLPSLAGA